MQHLSGSLNVFGLPLQVCSLSPKTGYVRDGYCQCIESDFGNHSICVQVTDSFLLFSKQKGNDLSTPNPDYDFPGLNAGDQWCLCLSRWIEAHKAGCAPKVILEATNYSVLEHVSLDTLKEFQV